MNAPVLTRRALNRATLARQHLLARSPMTAEDMVAHLVGMQAQAPHCAYYGLWSRIEGFRFQDLSALLADRRVVRIALMRSTIHLVTAADALALRPLVQPVISSGLASNTTYGKGIKGIDLDEVLALGRALMEERPRTNAELRDAFAATWPDRDAASLAYAIRCLVPAVQVPPRGLWNRSGAIAHTTARHWLGADLDATSTVDDMVLRYLAAFGPASVMDVQKWCGLTRLREVAERLRPRLLTFRDENGVELFDLPDAPRPGADTPSPARLVAPFDNLVLSHADRTRVIDDVHLSRIMTVNGIVVGSFLVDGFYAGAWDIARGKKSATVTITPFRPLTATELDAVTAEAADLLTATDPGLDHDVRVQAG